MNALMWLTTGFVFGGMVIGFGVSSRVNDCVMTYSLPCQIEHTWTGVRVFPTASQTERNEG